MGLIGSRECLERQIALVDAPVEELHAVIDAVAIDPDFTAFCKFARQASGCRFTSSATDLIM